METEHGMKEKRQLRKKRRRTLSIFGILILAVCVYVTVNIVVSRGTGLSTMVVYKGEVEDSFQAVGYVFRDQTVISAPASGYLYCEVPENERVKSGETVMSIYKTEINSRADSVLSDIDEKIDRLSRSKTESDIFGNDPTRVEQSISDELREVPKCAQSGELARVAEIRDEVNRLIEKKRIIAGEAQKTETADELEDLKAQRAKLIQDNNVEKTAVHAPKAGAFTARVDGMEELLGLDKLENISRDYIKELGRVKPEIKNESYVEKDAKIGKIVNNFTWSIAALTDKNDVEFMNIGQEIEIRFTGTDSSTLKGVVADIADMDDKNAVLVVRSNRYSDTVYSTSEADVEFVKHSYSGFKIPSESIRIINDKKGVFVIRNDEARFIPVNIRYSNKDWTVVAEETEGEKRLRLYDELIIDGKNLYDGKDVR